jgi:hypothetical protein
MEQHDAIWSLWDFMQSPDLTKEQIIDVLNGIQGLEWNLVGKDIGKDLDDQNVLNVHKNDPDKVCAELTANMGDAGMEFMKERGRMQVGMAADIVIFDPETVAEGASYKAGENGLPPVGMPHVIVNGQFVKRDDTATGIMAGLPIRYPAEDEGRHVPASTKQWLEEFTIDDGSLSR